MTNKKFLITSIVSTLTMMAEQARRYPQRFGTPDPSTNHLDMAYDAAQKQKN